MSMYVYTYTCTYSSRLTWERQRRQIDRLRYTFRLHFLYIYTHIYIDR